MVPDVPTRDEETVISPHLVEVTPASRISAVKEASGVVVKTSMVKSAGGISERTAL